MTRSDRDHYVLTTGRRIFANRGLISIAHQSGIANTDGRSHGFEVASGLDRIIVELQPAWRNRNEPSWDEFTTAEKIELAEFMIEQWTAFKRAIEQDEGP